MILAIEATTKTASCALYGGGILIGLHTVNNGYTHSETLLPLIDKTLSDKNLKVNDIKAFVVANGPGSFTGVRIALSTVKGLSHALDCPIYTVSTLRGLAYHGQFFDGLVCPILDARRGQVYSALYYQNNQQLPEATYQVDDLCKILNNHSFLDKRVLFVGDGVAVHKVVIEKSLKKRAFFGDLDKQNNTAAGLIAAYLAGDHQTVQYDKVPVNYLRVPQAERERKAKSNAD